MDSRWQTWFEEWLKSLLGVEDVAGQGTALHPEAPGAWHPLTLVLFVILAAVFTVMVYLREGAAPLRVKLGLATIRVLLVGLVLFMLTELQLAIQRTRLPYVVALLDTSASMAEVDHYDDPELRAAMRQKLDQAHLGEADRLNLAKALLLSERGKLLADLQQQRKLLLYSFSTSARRRWEPAGSSSGAPVTLSDAQALEQAIRELEPTGEQSRLGDGLKQVLNDLRGTPPAAIILFTDGITTEGETLSEAAVQARKKGIPLFAVGLGSDREERDLALSNLLVDDVVFADDIVSFEFTLHATGVPAVEKTKARLWLPDRSEPLAEVDVTVDPRVPDQQVRIPYRPTLPEGVASQDLEFIVEVAPLAQERQTKNNRLPPRRVQVRRERIGVLLVDSSPRFEFRYLRSLLERDRTISLKTVLQESGPEIVQQEPTALEIFPVSRDQLFSYDVVIFGDVNPAAGYLGSSAPEQLAAFVREKGGGIIFIAGPRFLPVAYGQTPLADLFPIELKGLELPPADRPIREPFPWKLTDLGRASPHLQLGDDPIESAKIWNQLPGGYWLARAPYLKGGAHVLMEHPSENGPDGKPLPVFAMQYVGAGTVLFHATDDTWRWRYRVGDVYFARYWVQAIRFLSRAKLRGANRDVELATDRQLYEPGEPVRVTVKFSETKSAPTGEVSVVLERAQARHKLTLSRNPSHPTVFEGTFREAAPGAYHLWLAAPTVPGQRPTFDFVVNAPKSERQRLPLDRVELVRSTSTGQALDPNGKALAPGSRRYYDFRTASRLASDLPPGLPVPDRSDPPIQLWNWWPVLLAFLSLLILEWLLRKRAGLL